MGRLEYAQMRTYMIRLWSLCVFLSLAHASVWHGGAGAAVAADPSQPAQELWRAVARSHRIVVGTLAVPVAAIRDAIRLEDRRYVEIGVRCEQVLKGPACSELAVRWYTGPSDWTRNAREMIALDNQTRIVFLTESDESKGLYFDDENTLGTHLATLQAIREIAAEVRSQQRLLEHFAHDHPPEKAPLYSEVKRLIDATTVVESQADAYRALQALGSRGVAAMILLMDDRRPLAKGWLAFRNPPGHWEEFALYRPEVVTDAMAAIVGHIAREDFGTLHNGGSERERRAAIDGWRVYYHHYCREEPTCDH